MYESLIGEELERKVGQVVTVQSLDYSKQTEILTDQDLEVEDVASDGNEMAEKGQTWLAQNFQRDLLIKGIPQARIKPVLEKFTRSYAIDVRGTLANHLQDKEEPESLPHEFSIDALIESLKSASRDALRRRQQLCFQRLVAEVMLPFYEEHAKLGELRQFKGDERVKLPSLKRLLTQVQDVGHQALMGSVFSGTEERSARHRVRSQSDRRLDLSSLCLVLPLHPKCAHSEDPYLCPHSAVPGNNAWKRVRWRCVELGRAGARRAKGMRAHGARGELQSHKVDHLRHRIAAP